MEKGAEKVEKWLLRKMKKREWCKDGGKLGTVGRGAFM